MNGHKANGRFIVGINIQSAYRYQITLLVDDHLVMRHRIPRVAFEPLVDAGAYATFPSETDSNALILLLFVEPEGDT